MAAPDPGEGVDAQRDEQLRGWAAGQTFAGSRGDQDRRRRPPAAPRSVGLFQSPDGEGALGIRIAAAFGPGEGDETGHLRAGQEDPVAGDGTWPALAGGVGVLGPTGAEGGVAVGGDPHRASPAFGRHAAGVGCRSHLAVADIERLEPRRARDPAGVAGEVGDGEGGVERRHRATTVAAVPDDQVAGAAGWGRGKVLLRALRSGPAPVRRRLPVRARRRRTRHRPRPGTAAPAGDQHQTQHDQRRPDRPCDPHGMGHVFRLFPGGVHFDRSDRDAGAPRAGVADGRRHRLGPPRSR